MILSAPTYSAFAGDEEGGKKGIRAGYQVSNFLNDGKEVSNNLGSFYIGVYGEKKLLPILLLGTGVEYNSSGYSSETPNSSYVRHAVAVPVYLKVKLGPVFALGGAAASFGVANKATLNDQDIDLSDDQKTNVFNLPVYLGVGVKIMMISLEARYHLGTMDLDKSDTETRTNHYLQVGAAISF